MSAARTVTVHTRDHGPVTVPEPAWCLGNHQPGGYRAEILHLGPAVDLTFQGFPISIASLAQSPYADGLTRGPGVSVSMVTQSLDPDGLDALAAVLVEHAVALRHLARQLAVLLAGGAR